MKVRAYGIKPYKIVVVHGGPGGLGSVAGLARGLAIKYGVIEPMQSKYTIDELIDELKEQIIEYCDEPMVLIGHSWGAWLVALFAERYPELVKKLILIGSGPLLVKYVEQIGIRRKLNLTKEEGIEFDELVKQLNEASAADKDIKLQRLGELCKKADNFSEIELETEDADKLPSDGEMYSKIWSEAAKLRENEKLINAFRKINIPLTIIHGDIDPHPVSGVVEPLDELKVAFKAYVLEKCGHTPWKEKFSSEEFYKILFKEIEQSIDMF
jgi:pimeloyl-ACP methyl ester carboxylesterase